MYSKTEYIFIKNEIHSGVHFKFCENVLRFGVALHISTYGKYKTEYIFR
jgi:hypothetical protein